MRRFLIAVVAVALSGLILAGSAQACSCSRSTPARSLSEADAAIAGRLLAVVPRGRLRAVYRYRVRRVYRGRRWIHRGQVVGVLSARSAPACGLPHRVGSRYGLFLDRSPHGWVSGICGLIAPRRLWLAARRLRRGNGPSQGGSAGGCPNS